MPEQFGDKTHDATPFRRQQARDKGQVARSQDLGSAVLLVGAMAGLIWWGPRIGGALFDYMQRQLSEPPELDSTVEGAMVQWQFAMPQLMRVMAPLFGLLVLLALLTNLAQVGFLFLPDKLTLDFNRINPLKGIQRLLSVSNLVRLGFGVIKLLIVAGVGIWSVWAQIDNLMQVGDKDSWLIGMFIYQTTVWTCMKIGIALLILALIDYGFQRWKHEQELKMTTQEVRDELKTLQGDPQVAARRRAVQRQLVLNRIGSVVPQTDVVVTNPTELAVAIRYDIQTMAAPVVAAKGAGVLAQRIRRIALENDVPIVERKELAQALYKNVEVNEAIPSQQYAAVAEVLRYVYELKGRSLEDVQREVAAP